MRIGVPREQRPGERLVAATPTTVARLADLGYEVVVEHDAGAAAPVVLASTHERCLDIVPLEVLQRYAVDVPDDLGSLDD